MSDENNESNHTISKVAVVLIARNEEDVIYETLKHILNQKLSPYRIIVINDGSTDKTGEIVAKFSNVEIINREKHTESFLARKQLAETINAGLQKLQNDNDCEFVWLMGADLIFSQDYLSKIVNRMKKNPKIAIASGVVQDEFSIEPRGGGRIVRCDFWRKIGLLYPVNYGWEGYLVLKAQSMGYEVESFEDLVITSQRKTGKKFEPKRYFYYGLALKALGYTTAYTLAKVLLFSKNNPKGAYYMLKGYYSKYDSLYEPELREFVRKNQRDNITNLKSNYVKRFIKTLINSK